MRIPLASYGRREILLGSAFCLGVAILCWLTFPPLVAVPALAWAFLLSFFRDPERHSDGSPRALVCPADGTVADIELTTAPAFLQGPTVRIGIFMSVFNVHVNRSPVAGIVRYVEYFPGKFHDARSELSKSRNEHNLIGLETPDGRKILVNQIAGVLARRIVCPLVVGAALERGERLGMIKLGSRVEIYVPLSDGPVTKVRVGQRVKGGLDALVEYGSGRR